jgi:hypothetical protein
MQMMTVVVVTAAAAKDPRDLVHNGVLRANAAMYPCALIDADVAA